MSPGVHCYTAYDRQLSKQEVDHALLCTHIEFSHSRVLSGIKSLMLKRPECSSHATNLVVL